MGNILVIPSIDIKDKKTVRVVKGIPELDSPEYGDDPVDMAMIWRAENAKCIHIVDFDAAMDNSHINFDIIEEICSSVIIPVQLGGGIRSYNDAKEAIELGVYRLIIGTMAFSKSKIFCKVLEKFGPNKIVAAIDVVDDEVVINGRTEKTGVHVNEYTAQLKQMGVKRYIVTDVQTNGTLVGPNIELSQRIADITEQKVTLSGGIGGYPDLRKVVDEGSSGTDSVIIGRALYENRFPCQKIWRKAESGIFN